MSKFFGFIKEHPYGTAAAVFAIGIIYIFSRGSSSGGTTTVINSGSASDATEVQAATQVQLANIASQTQQAQYNAALQSTSLTTGAQVTVAQLQAQQNIEITSYAADVQKSIAAMNAQTTQEVATLQAHSTDLQTQALTTIALAPYDVQKKQLDYAYALEMAKMAQGPDVNQAQIDAIIYNEGVMRNAFNELGNQLSTRAGGGTPSNFWIGIEGQNTAGREGFTFKPIPTA